MVQAFLGWFVEAIEYIHPSLEPVLARTLGVPLFQEQMLKIAMIMADFDGGEAEELRRAISFHFLEIEGRLQHLEGVVSVLAQNVRGLNAPAIIQGQSYDFH